MGEINGYTRTCGLIGNPVEHTMSPVIHNTLAEITGENLCYVPFHVMTGCLADAIKGAYALNLQGLNVTVPYKSDVMEYLVEIDPLAKSIGAVNTLVRVEGGYKGYNTDMPGLFRAMCDDGVKIAGENVLILGAGGVARAVAMLLAKNNAGKVIILNRTLEKAEAIAQEVNESVGKSVVQAMLLSAYESLPEGERFLAIQATNVGMYPKVEDAVIADDNFYQRIHTGYDLIFNPFDTRFMKLVRKQGGNAYNGLKMLLYQGIIAYEHWTGQSIEDELASKVYERMKDAMGIT